MMDNQYPQDSFEKKLKIRWPTKKPKISKKDMKMPEFDFWVRNKKNLFFK